MNWGWRIFFVYIGFVAIVATMYFISQSAKVELVTDNYYQKTLEYQSTIDAKENAQIFGDSLGFVYNSNNQTIVFHFPKELSVIDGEVTFYRPSDSKKDFKIPTRTTPGTQELTLSSLDAGVWHIQMLVKSSGKTYLSEGKITIDK